jgi:hypothetical protein
MGEGSEREGERTGRERERQRQRQRQKQRQRQRQTERVEAIEVTDLKNGATELTEKNGGR